MKNVTEMKNIIFASILIFVAVMGRTLVHLGPNIEFLTVTALLAGVFLPKKFSVIVPFLSIAISDFLLKNSPIFIFTWSAWIIIGLSGLILKTLTQKYKKTIILASFWAVITSVFFFLWTNFGVWLEGWYPQTLQGLMDSYIMGLPFLKLNLLGNLFIVPIGFTIASMVKSKLTFPALSTSKK